MRTQFHHLVSRAPVDRTADPALTHKDETLTYRELWARSVGFARHLADVGLGRGERVAVYLDKRPETVAAMLGTSAAGGVFVPVNPLLRARQVAHILRDCGVRVLVTTPERLATLTGELASCPELREVVLIGRAPVDGLPVAVRISPWPEAAADEDGTDAPADRLGVVDTDMAAILYTSGSTGLPKGVVVSHRNLLVGAESVSSYLGNTADDVILSVLPLSFDAGLSQLTTAFAVGAHAVLLNYLLPGDVVRACARHGVTGLTCVPPLWIQLAGQSWPAEATRSLRYFANTGGRMPRATLATLREIFPGARPYLMYGLTEAFRSTYLDPAEVDRRPDSIGKAIPDAEVLVVRPDGSLCGPGEEGELVHRGPLVSLGYWNDPVRTAERFRPAPGRDPALCTPELAVWSGDAVVRDEEGFLYFVGRADDMIKTSGYRVSPTEVEEAAYDTGLVREAVALGVDDPVLGQRIVVLATPALDGGLDGGQVVAAMRSAVPSWMVPHRVEVRPDLPRSANGKLDRATLRNELRDELRAPAAGSVPA